MNFIYTDPTAQKTISDGWHIASIGASLVKDDCIKVFLMINDGESAGHIVERYMAFGRSDDEKIKATQLLNSIIWASGTNIKSGENIELSKIVEMIRNKKIRIETKDQVFITIKKISQNNLSEECDDISQKTVEVLSPSERKIFTIKDKIFGKVALCIYNNKIYVLIRDITRIFKYKKSGGWIIKDYVAKNYIKVKGMTKQECLSMKHRILHQDKGFIFVEIDYAKIYFSKKENASALFNWISKEALKRNFLPTKQA